MGRFYFDCFDGTSALTDQHGITLDGVHEVADQANELAAKLLTENLGRMRSRTVSVSVRDESGRAIYSSFSNMFGRYLDHDGA